eukprot:CAMPEP_0204188380 /NCGR_PEP_ID=MMETSP0361-20130328/57592_1 /ASSEMBLY_ACC=CAM_ASM_000343 /TAXON_ID=268821 /ORGANISM="Scrippsiella Hangoei, Strain SHTV-5" /LENGTH=255 /DNA_ID=CAMNT_0051148921 /DNA_START=43 /DNA_END=806 /DNA_ORIENTATION=+
MEVTGTRVEEAVLVISMRLNLNLMSMPIEDVVSKRRKLVVDMCDNLKMETVRQLGTWSDEDVVPFRVAVQDRISFQLDDFSTKDAEVYNTDEDFVDFVTRAFHTRQAAEWFPEIIKLATGKPTNIQTPKKALDVVQLLKIETHPFGGFADTGYSKLVQLASDDLTDLRSAEPMIRARACVRIEQKQAIDSTVLTCVAELLADDSENVREKAELALTHHRKISKDNVEAAVEGMLASDKAAVRMSAFDLLVQWDIG